MRAIFIPLVRLIGVLFTVLWIFFGALSYMAAIIFTTLWTFNFKKNLEFFEKQFFLTFQFERYEVYEISMEDVCHYWDNPFQYIFDINNNKPKT